jgi:hypothetical protein
MAKRFTDSTKWSNSFIRSLKAPYKLLWLYILDECDHAGIWQVDFEVAQIKIGEKINQKDALIFFASKIINLNDKWFIPNFIEFQYTELNPQNRAHNSVITILKKYNLLDEFYKIKPLTSPLQGAMVMDKDKDMVKVMVMDKEKEQNFNFPKSELELCFDKFIEMRKKIKKPPTPHAIDLLKEKIKTLSNGNETLAIEIINQSILNSWQDLFPLRETNKKSNTTENLINSNFKPRFTE